MKTITRGLGLAVAGSMLLLAGCVSPGGYGSAPGDYGQPGGGYPSSQYPSQQGSSPYGDQWQGTVDGLDPGASRILVLVDDPRTRRSERMELRYDQRTRLTYQGRESAVTGLERGDVIRFDAAQSGDDLYARNIEVVRNVRDGGGGYGNDSGNGDRYGGGSPYGSGGDLSGSIGFVDTRSRVIRLDGSSAGNGVQLAYDGRTSVEYEGNRYRVENLERGDLVRIQARQVGNGQWLAERIVVDRSVSR